jgi:hypothetical protein
MDSEGQNTLKDRMAEQTSSSPSNCTSCQFFAADALSFDLEVPGSFETRAFLDMGPTSTILFTSAESERTVGATMSSMVSDLRL